LAWLLFSSSLSPEVSLQNIIYYFFSEIVAVLPRTVFFGQNCFLLPNIWKCYYTCLLASFYEWLKTAIWLKNNLNFQYLQANMQQQYGTTLAFHVKVTKEYNTHHFPFFGSETKDHNLTHTKKHKNKKSKKSLYEYS